MRRNYLKILVFSVAVCLVSTTYAVAQTKSKKKELILSRCWSYSLGETAGLRVTADELAVFAGTEGGKVHALSPDGKKLWSAELGGEVSSRLLATAAALYLVTTSVKEDGAAAGDSSLYSLSRETGVTNWSTKLPGANIYFLDHSPRGLIALSSLGAVQNVDAANGRIVWGSKLGEAVEVQPVLSGNELLAVSGGRLRRLSLDSGQSTLVAGVDGEVTSVRILDDGLLVFGNGRGLVSVGVGSASKWRFRSGGAVSAILPLDGSLLLASHDNFIYHISMRQGHVDWRRRLPGRVFDVARFGERWAIAETLEENSPLVIVDLDNGKTAAQLPLGANETVADHPHVNGNTLIFMTNQSVYAYSGGTCSSKKESGPAK